MQSVHLVGIVNLVAIVILYLCLSRQIDRIEEKIDMLLKQQVNKQKPKGIRKWHDGYVGDCPSCSRVVQFAQKHCHNCLQLLDWSEVLEMGTEDDS